MVCFGPEVRYAPGKDGLPGRWEAVKECVSRDSYSDDSGEVTCSNLEKGLEGVHPDEDDGWRGPLIPPLDMLGAVCDGFEAVCSFVSEVYEDLRDGYRFIWQSWGGRGL